MKVLNCVHLKTYVLNDDAISELLSEESFKDLFDNAHDLIQISSIAGEIIYANHSWTSVLEYSLDEIQGHSIYSLVHEADLEKFTAYREAIISGEKIDNEITVRYKSRSGKEIFLEGFISLRRKDERPVYTRGIFRDITHKIEQQKILLESENNLQQILLNAPDAIILINKESLVTFWNPQAEKMFGWHSSEVLNQQLSEKIIPPEYREAHHHGMEKYLATGEAAVLNKTIELTALNKSGEQFYVSLTISPTTQNGDIAFIAFLRDIKEQKQNEAELGMKRRELEISNQQLERFAHVASHDMKEPIRKIRFFMSMLETAIGEGLTEKEKSYLSKIDSSSKRLQSMVEGVLKYATIRGIKEDLKPVDLNSVIETIKNDLEVLINEKAAVITYQALPAVQGINFLIYQMFYNLIQNSLKFSKPDVTPIITITATERFDEHFRLPVLPQQIVSFIEVRITDNGIGFQQEYAEKIFQAFSRLNTNTRYEGTGLGLSLCKIIAERHNGSLTAEGEEGIGATFFVSFPVYKL